MWNDELTRPCASYCSTFAPTLVPTCHYRNDPFVLLIDAPSIIRAVHRGRSWSNVARVSSNVAKENSRFAFPRYLSRCERKCNWKSRTLRTERKKRILELSGNIFTGLLMCSGAPRNRISCSAFARAPDVTSCKSRCKMYERYMCNWSIEVIYVAIAYLLTA